MKMISSNEALIEGRIYKRSSGTPGHVCSECHLSDASGLCKREVRNFCFNESLLTSSNWELRDKNFKNKMYLLKKEREK